MTTRFIAYVILGFLLAIAGFAQEKPTVAMTAKTFRAVVEVPGRDTIIDGKLTFAETGLSFESADLFFSIPVADTSEILIAGFKEDFLKVKVFPDSDFAKSYDFLYKKEPAIYGQKPPCPTVKIQLWPKEPLPQAMEAARTFKALLDNYHAQILAKSVSEKPAQVTEGEKKALAAAPAAGPTQEDKPTEQPRKLLHKVTSGGYVPSLKGASKMLGMIQGVDGSTLFFSDGIGFKSDSPKPSKVPAGFLDDQGFFKFFLPAAEIASYRLNKGDKCYLLYVTLKTGDFLTRNRQLLTDQGTDTEKRREVILGFMLSVNTYQIQDWFEKNVKEDF